METYDVAVVVYARVHGTDQTDAERRLCDTVKVEIGTPGGPMKRAIGATPPGHDVFIQVAGVLEAPHAAQKAREFGLYKVIDSSARRDVS